MPRREKVHLNLREPPKVDELAKGRKHRLYKQEMELWYQDIF